MNSIAELLNKLAMFHIYLDWLIDEQIKKQQSEGKYSEKSALLFTREILF